MPRLIYDFGRNRRRGVETSAVWLAVELALNELGTIGAVCEAVGVNRNCIAAWKDGAVPQWANLQTLAELAGVPVEWLEED